MLTSAAVAFRLLTLALAPFFTFLGAVTVAAYLHRPRPLGGRPDGPRARLLFVIPAHDEEADIAATVASCRAVDHDPADFAVWVIADNCGDSTGEAARAAGAEVVERRDPDRRSKGYALEYFFERATVSGVLDRFDAVVVVDADTLVDPGLPAAFSAALAGGAEWAQCYYTVRNPDASWRTRLLTYALGLFNGVWLLGQDGLGLGAGFRGNGMCFTTRGLARFPWKVYGLVEDQEFSWQLRLAGERVRFVPETRVYAEMVSRGDAAVSQRRRWEQGRRELRSRFRGAVLRSGALSLWRKLLFLVDLQFPPLVPLFAAFLAAAAVHPLAWLDPRLAPLSGSLAPWHALMGLSALGYAAGPFLLLGLPPRYLASVAALPYYAAWKASAALRSKTKGWVRTRRQANPATRG